jgi:hypothetical protein
LLVSLHGLIQENLNMYLEGIEIKVSIIGISLAFKEKMKFIFQDIAHRT